MLNVVNFGGGAYVIYAEVLPTGEIEVDPEPYSDTFDRPARLLPIEAKALVAAIDLLGLAPVRAPAHGAREDRRRARRRPGRGGPADRLRRAPTTTIARTRRARAIARAPAARARVLDAERGPLLRARRRAVRADQRARGLVRRRLRPVARTTCATSGWTAIKRADRARRDLRAAREASTRSPTSRAGRAPARSGARASRACGSRPSRRAGRARSAPCWPSSPTAR